MPALAYLDFDKKLRTGDVDFFLLAVHGPNEDLKSDILRAVRQWAGVDLNDPFRFVRLDGDVLDADIGRLADELGAISMFGGARLIEVKCTPRQAEHCFRQACAAPHGDVRLVVSAGDLSEADWLGSYIAQSNILTVACAEERAGDFRRFVAESFTAADLTWDEPAIDALISLVGDDRAAVKSEIEKLSALLGPHAKVSLGHIKEVVADASSMLADEVAQAAFAGDCEDLSQALDRLKIAGSDPVQALGAALRQAINLHRGKVRQWGGRADPQGPVWSAADARQLTRSLAAAVRQTRTDSAQAALFAERALVALGQTARLKKRR